MSKQKGKRDLLVLVPDGQMQAAVKGILSRRQAMGIRLLTFEVHRHPRHDNGCCGEGVEFFRPFVSEYHHALLMFDREGCGQETMSADELEERLETNLGVSGWRERAAVVVLD